MDSLFAILYILMALDRENHCIHSELSSFSVTGSITESPPSSQRESEIDEDEDNEEEMEQDKEKDHDDEDDEEDDEVEDGDEEDSHRIETGQGKCKFIENLNLEKKKTDYYLFGILLTARRYSG